MIYQKFGLGLYFAESKVLFNCLGLVMTEYMIWPNCFLCLLAGEMVGCMVVPELFAITKLALLHEHREVSESD